MDGTELSIEEIEALSRLPSLDVMHSQLVGMIASPLSGLVRTLNALLSGIAIALGQIQEQGLVTGTAPEPAADAAPAADADAPAADAEAAPEAETSAPEALCAEDTPSPPADAPEPEAAEEIPNQPMPAPEQAEQTSNEEGDN